VNTKILLSLPDEHIKALQWIGETEQRTRTDLIREAIETYVARIKSTETEDAFGLWKGKGIDGVEYQRRLRAEW